MPATSIFLCIAKMVVKPRNSHGHPKDLRLLRPYWRAAFGPQITELWVRRWWVISQLTGDLDQKVNLGGLVLSGNLLIDGCSAPEGLRLTAARIDGELRIQRLRSDGPAYLDALRVKGNTYITECHFYGDVHLGDGDFKGVFLICESAFYRYVSIRSSKFQEYVWCYANAFHGYFNALNCLFERETFFEKNTFSRVNTFDRIAAKRSISFAGSVFLRAPTVHDSLFDEDVRVDRSVFSDFDSEDAYPGYHALRLLFATRNDRSREMQFFVREHEALRRRSTSFSSAYFQECLALHLATAQVSVAHCWQLLHFSWRLLAIFTCGAITHRWGAA